ncbi:MAG: GNAT family N-acetyltransferase, partial [Candidatus Thermoplasmatota archaeon]
GLWRVPLRPDEFRLHRMDFEASGGLELFLSYEDDSQETLVGYARLRICNTGAFLRELKVFGRVVPISARPGSRWQHRGYGARLLAECERIAAEEHGRQELLVTSGVGVREYYRRFGYAQSGPYMAKALE